MPTVFEVISQGMGQVVDAAKTFKGAAEEIRSGASDIASAGNEVAAATEKVNEKVVALAESINKTKKAAEGIAGIEEVQRVYDPRTNSWYAPPARPSSNADLIRSLGSQRPGGRT